MFSLLDGLRRDEHVEFSFKQDASPGEFSIQGSSSPEVHLLDLSCELVDNSPDLVSAWHSLGCEMSCFYYLSGNISFARILVLDLSTRLSKSFNSHGMAAGNACGCYRVLQSGPRRMKKRGRLRQKSCANAEKEFQ